MLAALLLLLTQSQESKFHVRVPPTTPAETKWPEHTFSNKPAKAGSFDCRVAAVTDGDTFRCRDGTRIRLSAIDTAEMPGSCRPGRKCAPGNPYAAKAALSGMISGQNVQCAPTGKSYDRTVAWCSVGGRDLSCAMVANGHAVRLARFWGDHRC